MAGNKIIVSQRQLTRLAAAIPHGMVESLQNVGPSRCQNNKSQSSRDQPSVTSFGEKTEIEEQNGTKRWWAPAQMHE